MFEAVWALISRTIALFASFIATRNNAEINKEIDDYTRFHDDKQSGDAERKSFYMKLVNLYYNVSTVFYEWGWGQSFHFATRNRGETFESSIMRHEAVLANFLRVGPGSKVLDVGCGIGGPLRNISRMTGAAVTGINNNDYQIARGNTINQECGLVGARLVKADFNNMTKDGIDPNSYDGAYTIEATCHSPDRTRVFGEIYKALKPGKIFAGYEWCLTDKYNEKEPEHVTMKKNIQLGNGLPDLTHISVVEDALKAVGFKLLLIKDLAAQLEPGAEPWYGPLTPSYFSLSHIQHTWLGRLFGAFSLSALEFLRIAPRGTKKVSDMLNQGAEGLVAGGKQGTFTPMLLFVAQKEDNENKADR